MAQVEATVVRENLVRFAGVPLTVRVPSLPELAPGTRVRLELKELDLLERTVGCIYRETLGGDPAVENVTSDTSQKA
jgi:exoribonuclease-2